MAIDRTTIFSGPGYITYRGATILCDGNITARLVTESVPGSATGFGRVKKVRKGTRVEVTAKPARWTSLSVLFPYASTQIGASIFGATDNPLVIVPLSGKGISVVNAAVTGLGGLALGATPPGGNPIGQVTWTGLVANNSDPADMASYFTDADPGSLPSSITLTDWKTGAYAATYNSVPFQSATGFNIGFQLGLSPVETNNEGVVDMLLQSLEASCTVEPLGVDMTDLMTWISAVGPGGSESAYDLAITGPVNVTLANCTVESIEGRYGDTVLQNGALQFASLRKVATGALAALWTFS